MDAIEKELDRLTGRANLSKSIQDIDRTLDLLLTARSTIEADPSSAASTLAALEPKVKAGFDKATENLKEFHNGIGKYGKALDKKFKPASKKDDDDGDYDVLKSHQTLTNRAIAMHLLREGNFDIADTFIQEASLQGSIPKSLEAKFREMNHIQEALRRRDLGPAIEWAGKRRDQLDAKASDLEFELHRLQYLIHLYSKDDGPRKALEYSRVYFLPFQQKYLQEISQLAGALIWRERTTTSVDSINTDSAWDKIVNSFTQEFCALLDLSAESPLYVTTTAGAIALPTFIKLKSIMKVKGTQWTTQNELPVEIPLPDKFKYHSIFVCPVSKEQTTDLNPPMMIPCGHVLAKDTVNKLSRNNGTRYKCPYCPADSVPRDAREIYL